MSRSLRRPIAAGLTVLVALAVWWLQQHHGARGTASPPKQTVPAGEDHTEILRAWRDGRNGVWVTGRAKVWRLLADDLAPPRHQRLLFRAGPDLTVKLSHNIDLAPRLPLKVGDEFEYHGQYEMGEHGAFVHWTHHDPAGRHGGGWVRADETTWR